MFRSVFYLAFITNIAFALLNIPDANAKTSSQSESLRLILTAKYPVERSSFSVSAMALALDLLQEPAAAALGGYVSYQGNGWSTDLGACAIINHAGVTAMPFVSASLYPDFFHAPLFSYSAVRWVDPGVDNLAIVWHQIDVITAPNFLMLGAESENFLTREEQDYSIGPQLVVMYQNIALTGAYQFHTDNGRMLWFRLKVSL